MENFDVKNDFYGFGFFTKDQMDEVYERVKTELNRYKIKDVLETFSIDYRSNYANDSKCNFAKILISKYKNGDKSYKNTIFFEFPPDIMYLENHETYFKNTFGRQEPKFKLSFIKNKDIWWKSFDWGNDSLSTRFYNDLLIGKENYLSDINTYKITMKNIKMLIGEKNISDDAKQYVWEITCTPVYIIHKKFQQYLEKGKINLLKKLILKIIELGKKYKNKSAVKYWTSPYKSKIITAELEKILSLEKDKTEIKKWDEDNFIFNSLDEKSFVAYSIQINYHYDQVDEEQNRKEKIKDKIRKYYNLNEDAFEILNENNNILIISSPQTMLKQINFMM